MLLKKIIGILIILFNVAGLGFLLYMLAMMLKEKFLGTESVEETITTKTSARKPKPKIANDNIIPDEDDLLKDMDLSDLDSLNLDDFD